MTDAAVLASEAQKSGPIGLAVILVLCVACYFLFKSMSRHMRKVREQWPQDKPDAQRPGTQPAGERPQQAEGPGEGQRAGGPAKAEVVPPPDLRKHPPKP